MRYPGHWVVTLSSKFSSNYFEWNVLLSLFLNMKYRHSKSSSWCRHRSNTYSSASVYYNLIFFLFIVRSRHFYWLFILITFDFSINTQQISSIVFSFFLKKYSSVFTIKMKNWLLNFPPLWVEINDAGALWKHYYYYTAIVY